MAVEELAAPICEFQEEKDPAPCGKTMFRIGTPAVYGWVCEFHDKVDRSTSLD